MNTIRHLETVNQLIAVDENSIAVPELTIAGLTIPDATIQSSLRRSYVDAWKADLLTLRQELEGLKLKRDALMESQESFTLISSASWLSN